MRINKDDLSRKLVLHEMAHVFAQTTGLQEDPAPLGPAFLYFNGQGFALCDAGEFLADVLQMSVGETHVAPTYWNRRMSDRSRDAGRDFDLNRTIDDAYGIWSDGETVRVVEVVGRGVNSYSLQNNN